MSKTLKKTSQQTLQGASLGSVIEDTLGGFCPSDKGL